MGREEINQKLLTTTAEEEEEAELPFRSKVWTEAKKMWVVAAPATFTRFSTFGINVVSQAFIGHIGSTQLAAYSLVFTVLLRFANGVLLGMASALETLCGQSFGAKQYHMLGIYLQRSWIVLILCATLMLPIFIFTTPLLELLGQEAYIAQVGGTISLWLIPVMFASIVSYTCQMFLQAQSRNLLITYLAAASMTIHIFLSWLLTMKYKYGIPGAMISTILAYWIPNVGQICYVTCGGCRETWKGFSFLAFKDLWPVVKLSLSSGAMLWCVFIFFFFLFSPGLGLLNTVSHVCFSNSLNINGWEMMISLGFLAAASVRVSNELGRGNSKGAKFAIIMTVATSFIIGVVLFLVFLFLKGKVAYLFTESSEVVDAVADLSPFLAFSILLNSIQPVLSGVAIGSGWQSIVAYVNIACYYLVGIPVGVVLGYVFDMQVKGVWIGMLIGTFIQTIILMVITYRTDWDKQVLLARNRVNKWYAPVPDSEEGS
ncbi:Protein DETOXIFICATION 21 [Linum perenne]